VWRRPISYRGLKWTEGYLEAGAERERVAAFLVFHDVPFIITDIWMDTVKIFQMTIRINICTEAASCDR